MAKAQDKYLQPSGAAGVIVSADREEARKRLQAFINDVKKLDDFLQKNRVDKLVNGSAEDITAKRVDRWFGSYRPSHLEALSLKANRMIEVISGTTGWKFVAWRKYTAQNKAYASHNGGTNKFHQGDGKFEKKTINLTGKYFDQSPSIRANIIIHEAVHATNGPGVGLKRKRGHYMTPRNGMEAMQFTVTSAYMTKEQAILNADSWECYFGNGVC